MKLKFSFLFLLFLNLSVFSMEMKQNKKTFEGNILLNNKEIFKIKTIDGFVEVFKKEPEVKNKNVKIIVSILFQGVYIKITNSHKRIVNNELEIYENNHLFDILSESCKPRVSIFSEEKYYGNFVDEKTIKNKIEKWKEELGFDIKNYSLKKEGNSIFIEEKEEVNKE